MLCALLKAPGVSWSLVPRDAGPPPSYPSDAEGDPSDSCRQSHHRECAWPHDPQIFLMRADKVIEFHRLPLFA